MYMICISSKISYMHLQFQSLSIRYLVVKPNIGNCLYIYTYLALRAKCLSFGHTHLSMAPDPVISPIDVPRTAIHSPLHSILPSGSLLQFTWSPTTAFQGVMNKSIGKPARQQQRSALELMKE